MTNSQDHLKAAKPDELDVRNAIQRLRNSPEYQKLSKHYAGQTFFNILRIARDENVHSDFVAWLLNPSSDHGLGTFPICKFLEMLIGILRETRQSERAAELFPMELADFLIAGNYSISDVQIRREYVVADKRRIDIVITLRFEAAHGASKDFLIVLENKVYSGETSSQTVDYWRWATEQQHSDLFPGINADAVAVVGVYLTPLPETDFLDLCRCQCESAHFIQANYQSLMDHVLNHVMGQEIREQARFVVEQYVRNLGYPCSLEALTSSEITKGDMIMAIGMEERKLLKDFYMANKPLLLAVLTALKDDAEPELQDSINQVIAVESGSRKPTDKPISIQFGECAPMPVSSWKDVLLSGMNLAMDKGLSPTDFPIDVSKSKEDYEKPLELNKGGYFIESKLGMSPILRQIGLALARAGVPSGFMKITTRTGIVHTSPPTEARRHIERLDDKSRQRRAPL